MNKKIAIIGLVILVLIGAAYFVTQKKTALAPADDARMQNQDEGQAPAAADAGGKLKVANFEGTLEEVNTGCYADGECYVLVDGKHITTLMGWSRDTVGTADFDALSATIGKNVEVYAKDNGDGTYTLYGNEGFYVRLK